MYEELLVNVKDEPRSTLTFTRDFSYIASILFTYVNFTRKWKSALKLGPYTFEQVPSL